jgi:hypothetical protein
MLITAMGKKLLVVTALSLLCACGSGVYVRDGVTDGDTFYLTGQALEDDDPVLQSWVAYSLAISACKLLIGGPNPARVKSFACERTARQHLVERWRRQRDEDTNAADIYLDSLLAITDAGRLDESVERYHGTHGGQAPDDLDMAAFRSWQKRHYPRHRPQTRITGSWNYARKVQAIR